MGDFFLATYTRQLMPPFQNHVAVQSNQQPLLIDIRVSAARL
jgi:hypothetical protein